MCLTYAQVSCSEGQGRCCPALDGVAATLRSGRSVHAAQVVCSLADQGAPLSVFPCYMRVPDGKATAHVHVLQQHLITGVALSSLELYCSISKA